MLNLASANLSSTPNSFRQKLQSLLIITLLSKVFIFGLIFLARQYPPYLEVCRTETFLDALQTWDTGHYLFLAEEGYQPILINRNAFPPLLPLLMRLFSPLFWGNKFLAGIVLANLFSLAMMFYFYLFVKERYSPQTAFVAGLFLLAFPTAFYLSFIYTESLFLMLVIIAFYALDKRRLAPVLVVGLLLPLTRMVGLLTAIPLIVQIMFTTRYAHQLSEKLKASALVGSSFGVGFALYLALMQYYTGSPFSGFEAQRFFPAHNSISNLLHPWQWVMKNYITFTYTINNVNGIVDRLFFLAFLVLLYLVFKKLDLTLFIYALTVGLVPALSDALHSFPRYMLIVFPVFIALALVFPRRYKYLVAPMLIMQALLVLVHSARYWVA